MDALETRGKFRRINHDLLLASTSLTRSSKESADAYLARVTHLHMQSKKIRVIENLEACPCLKVIDLNRLLGIMNIFINISIYLQVLYLYDNQIEKIENLNHLSILGYLYLQNNLIEEIPLLQLPNLRKLYLDDNYIQVVSGLNNCTMLEELHLARQKLPTFTSIQFEPQSLSAISINIQVLEISGCGISILSTFSSMLNLRRLICRDNLVADMDEVAAAVRLPKLEEANFIGNPCCKMFKYRDIAIGESGAVLTILDEVPIPRHQLIAIKGLMKERYNKGMLSKFSPLPSAKD